MTHESFSTYFQWGPIDGYEVKKTKQNKKPKKKRPHQIYICVITECSYRGKILSNKSIHKTISKKQTQTLLFFSSPP